MQPIQNLLFLAHTRIPLTILTILTTTMSKSSLASIFIALAVVRLLPSAANEQHISRLDVTALSRGTNIDSLVLAALIQVLPRVGVVVVGVVVDTLLVCVAPVV